MVLGVVWGHERGYGSVSEELWVTQTCNRQVVAPNSPLGPLQVASAVLVQMLAGPAVLVQMLLAGHAVLVQMLAGHAVLEQVPGLAVLEAVRSVQI